MTTDLKKHLDKTLVPCEDKFIYLEGIIDQARAIFKRTYKKKRFSCKLLVAHLKDLGYTIKRVNNKPAIMGYTNVVVERPKSKLDALRPSQKSEAERIYKLSKDWEKRKIIPPPKAYTVIVDNPFSLLPVAELAEKEAERRGVKYTEEIRLFAENTACDIAIAQIRELRKNYSQTTQ